MEIFVQMRVPDSLDPSRKQRSKTLVNIQIHTTVSLWTGGQRVEIHTLINNPAQDHRLRVHFPVPFKVSQAAYDGHFDIVHRKVGLPEWDMSWVEQPRPEHPQRMFTAVSDGNTGVVLAVRGLPEVEVRSSPDGTGELALTLLRCVGWLSRDDLPVRPGHAGPYMATPGAQMPGEHAFDYAIICYPGASDINATTAAYQQARNFNAPMRTEATGIHLGALPARCQFVQVEPAQFELSAIKPAEDGIGWVVRGYNPLPDPIQVVLRPWRRFSHVELARLDETRLGRIDCDSDGSVRIMVNPHSIVTLRYYD